MKKTLTIFFFILASLFSIGQTISISNTRFNILYLGIENPLLAVVENQKCDSFFLSTDNGKITGNSCHYGIIPSHVGKATVYAKIVQKHDTITLGETYFRVKRLPQPTARIAGETYGIISKELLAAQIAIRASLENYDIELDYLVTSYTVIIMHNQDSIFTRQIKEKEITEELKKEFLTLQHDDKVLFMDINATGSFGDEGVLNTIEFIIE